MSVVNTTINYASAIYAVFALLFATQDHCSADIWGALLKSALVGGLIVVPVVLAVEFARLALQACLASGGALHMSPARA